MSQVHEAITAHTRKQHAHLERFAELDEARETAIEEAVNRCKNGQPFTVDAINAITAQIIAHARNGISPLRKPVTEEMVREYVRRLVL